MTMSAYWNVTNVLAQMKQTSSLVSQTIERLSSGKKLNRAADDPSGSANAARLSGGIRGVNAAIQNAEQASLLFDTMDNVLSDISDILLNMRDLATRSSNEATMTTAVRKTLQTQVWEYVKEISTLARVANFNGKELSTGYEKVFFEYSPNGVTSDLKASDINGNNTENITETAGDYEASVLPSPDGTKIAFYDLVAADRDIYIMNSDGTNIRRITNNPGVAKRYFTWSPDGQWLAYEQSNQIYKISTSATAGVPAPTQLTADGAAGINAYRYPAWSPDGTKIMYHRLNDIWTMDTNGTPASKVNITVNAVAHPGNNRWARWAPDGSMITFMGNSPGTYETFTIEYADPDNTRTQRTTVGDAVLGEFAFPTFSLDKEQLFYTVWLGGNNYDLRRVDLENGQDVAIQTGPQRESSPVNRAQAFTLNKTFLTNPDDFGQITMNFTSFLPDTLGVRSVNVSTQAEAQTALTRIDKAIDKVSDMRADIGVKQQLMGYITDDLTSRSINMTSMRSRIEDADMAEEITKLTKAQLVQEAAVTSLVQANNERKNVLNLLNGGDIFSLLQNL